MESSQPDITITSPACGVALSIDQPKWMQDEDIALGFECANPALQIERWGLEQAHYQVAGAY